MAVTVVPVIQLRNGPAAKAIPSPNTKAATLPLSWCVEKANIRPAMTTATTDSACTRAPVNSVYMATAAVDHGSAPAVGAAASGSPARPAKASVRNAPLNFLARIGASIVEMRRRQALPRPETR